MSCRHESAAARQRESVLSEAMSRASDTRPEPIELRRGADCVVVDVDCEGFIIFTAPSSTTEDSIVRALPTAWLEQAKSHRSATIALRAVERGRAQ